jgi:hypothetical protein
MRKLAEYVADRASEIVRADEGTDLDDRRVATVGIG